MSTLATSYDLRQYAAPVLNQGQINSCAENAFSVDLSLIMNEAGAPITPISRLQLYADVRTDMNYANVNFFGMDIGTDPIKMMNTATTRGVASESSWAYDSSLLFEHPTADVVVEATQHKISGWSKINIEQAYTYIVDDVKAALSQGKSVMMALHLNNYFFYKSGPLATQVNFGDDGSAAGPGHMVTIVGMDDNLAGGSFIVQNSWGTGWGDNGYGTIAYKQFDETHSGMYDSGGNFIWPDLMGLYVIDGFGGKNFKYTDERVTMAKEYASLLGRPAEIAGLDWWADSVHSGATTKIALADLLINSAEGSLVYGKETNVQFVESMYENILGRQADSGGLAWWTTQLDTGITRGTLANVLMDSVSNSKADILAHDYLTNKVNLSSYISIAMQYNGSHDAIVKEAIAEVTTDANQIEIIKIGLHSQFTGDVHV